jgi:hypothetical protein
MVWKASPVILREGLWREGQSSSVICRNEGRVFFFSCSLTLFYH